MNHFYFGDQTKAMKPIQTAFNFLAILALAALALSCASNNDLLDRENAATGAGFKIITPTKPAQLARLRQLPVDKVTQIVVAGKPYYILPDPARNQAYVGGPKQYQAYRQFRQQQSINAKNYQAPPLQVEVVEVDDMGWGEWVGWAPVGEPGWY